MTKSAGFDLNLLGPVWIKDPKGKEVHQKARSSSAPSLGVP